MTPTIFTEEDKSRLYTDYYPKVSAYVHGKIPNTQDAEDAVSTVFLKVYRGLDGFDSDRASLSTWIYTITRNAVVDYFRSARHHAEYADYIGAEWDEIPDQGTLSDSSLDRLADALEQLKEKERDLILLHYYKGYTLKAVAQMMGMSYINAKVIHTKALSYLRELI